MSDADAYNPYAPPTAQVGSPAAVGSGLKHRNLVVMFVLLILTLGIYYPVWFFRRRPGLNRLDSSRKLALWPLLLFAGDFVLEVVAAILAGDQTVAQAFGSQVVLVMQLLQFSIGILMIIQCFAIKDIIEEHAMGPDDDSGEPNLFKPHVKLSGLMTFFFSIFYLQHAINKYVVGAQARL
jgi:cellobiose-specific phosphotransferase system component IIC